MRLRSRNQLYLAWSRESTVKVVREYRARYREIDRILRENREILALALRELEEKMETVSIANKGRRTTEETEREHAKAFRLAQRFRAGIDGAISVLKRGYELARCLFKGFRNFASSIGCAVFCHNLVVLART